MSAFGMVSQRNPEAQTTHCYHDENVQETTGTTLFSSCLMGVKFINHNSITRLG